MDYAWLKTQFGLHPQKSKAELAKALNMEPSAISKMLAGTRQIKAQEYVAMRRFFGLPSDGEAAIYGHSGNTAYKIEPFGNPDGFGEVEDEQDQEWIIPADVLMPRTKASPDKIKIFKVQESAMEPDFRHGDSVLMDLSDQNPSPPGVFVVSDGYGYMIRHCAFMPGRKPAEIKISAKADGFMEQILNLSEFKIIGRVIAKLQML